MKPTPPGWPRISSALFYDDAGQAIDWLCRAFGFEVRLRVEGDGGRIEHSELEYEGGLIMVSHSPEFVSQIKFDETLDLGALAEKFTEPS